VHVAELNAAIIAADATGRFDIRPEVHRGGQPSDMTVLEPADDGSGRWVVYYSERGRINDPVYFDTEDAACDFVYSRLIQPPPPPGPPMTARERARSVEALAEAKQRSRQMLIDAGYDPDTLKPFAP